jgi:hypothetical protein
VKKSKNRIVKYDRKYDRDIEDWSTDPWIRAQTAQMDGEISRSNAKLSRHEFEFLLEQIKAGHVTPTAKFMKSLKDLAQRQKVVEAVCLGKV